MFKVRRFLTVVALLLGVSTLAVAQAGGDGGVDFGLTIAIGAVTFDEDGTDVTYQMLKVSPDIAIGKFGIGLELTLHYLFAPDFQVREEDWVPSGDDTILDVYLPKFKYVRYGFKGDPLFVKLGSIDDALLGSGFIMGGYDNTLFLPERRIFGLSFDLDGALFNFPYFGIETFVANLAQFDVVGLRPFIRPLAVTEIPVIRNLQVGGTLAFDRKPGLYVGDDSLDTVLLYGADLRLPILANPALSLVTFADIAFLDLADTQGTGGMVGLGGRLIGFLNYGAQIRILGDNFVPTYFDYAYDLFRFEKYNTLATVGVEAYTGWLASLGFSFLEDTLSFNVTVDGPFKGGGDPLNYLDWPHLYARFVLGPGIIPNVSFEASWDKRSLGAQDGFFQDLVSPEDAVIGARLNYAIGAAVLSFVYQLSYTPGGGWETKSGIESAIQLF